jgi:aryl-alcohol dehydrogenase-like predicted oxidoreductase
MHLRKLGKSGLNVSAIGLGLAALGRPGYINLGHADDLEENYGAKAMEANAHRVLDLAWKLGIRYFDAARSYGRAEDFLSTWLRARDLTAEVIVGSKWGYEYTANWKVDVPSHEVKNHSISQLQKQWSESHALLHPGPNLYQIHSATQESGVLKNQQVLEELFRLKESGTRIGLSTSGPRQSEIILEAIEIKIASKRLFDTIQSTWNLLEQSATKALHAAHKSGVGVIIKEALANGRLTAKNRDPDFEDKYYLFEFHENQMNVTTDALALAAALNQPWADVVLSGATTPEQLESNMGALTVTWNDQMEQVLGFLREPSEEYWRTRSQLPWN